MADSTKRYQLMGRGQARRITATYTPTSGVVVYCVPQPTWTGKGVAKNSSDPSYTANGASDGADVTATSPFGGVYSSIVVTSGALDVYEDGE
jgi:hypothetical protein